MGPMDAINPENTVEIKFSEYQALIESRLKANLLFNALKCRVPEQYVREMLTGDSDEYQKYIDTGLKPEEISEVVKELVEERLKVQELIGKNKTLEDELKVAKEQLVKAAEPEPEQQGETKAEEEATGGDSPKAKAKTVRKPIDIGKIVALKKAGWEIKDIADEMHMEPTAVSNALWRYNKTLEEKKDE